jgi:hypothetical protein
MNDDERENWINNDEYLYNEWRSHRPRLSIREYIRQNRASIDAVIGKRLGSDSVWMKNSR